MSLLRRLTSRLGSTETPIVSDAPPRHWPPRPDGPVLWLHIPSSQPRSDASSLAVALQADVEDKTGFPVFLVLTGTTAPATRLPERVTFLRAPESTDSTRIFLDYWRPDWAAWLGPDLPDAVGMSAARTTHTVLWQPNGLPIPAYAQSYSEHLAADGTTAFALQQALRPDADVPTTGPLSAIMQPPVVPRLELEQLSARVAGRPLWLAAAPPLSEASALIDAAQQAKRRAHRALMVVLALPGDSPDWIAALQAAAFTVTDRDDPDGDGLPHDATDALIVDGMDELGLWLRLCAVTWLGGSLRGFQDQPDSAMDPLLAAAMGSALIAGPVSGPFSRNLSSLKSRGAVRRVANAKELGPVLAHLMGPDAAALQAAAGWEIATQGAPLLNALSRSAQRVLDSGPPNGDTDAALTADPKA